MVSPLRVGLVAEDALKATVPQPLFVTHVRPISESDEEQTEPRQRWSDPETVKRWIRKTVATRKSRTRPSELVETLITGVVIRMPFVEREYGEEELPEIALGFLERSVS